MANRGGLAQAQEHETLSDIEFESGMEEIDDEIEDESDDGADEAPPAKKRKA